MSDLVYFAYGSNMSGRRLRSRVPSAVSVGMAFVDDHALAFHKVSDVDGSGKCDIVESETDKVFGMLYRIGKVEKKVLDVVEGLGSGYMEKIITATDTTGNKISAFTYIATVTDPSLRPYTWYLQHVIEGAKEAGLPKKYLEKLCQVEAIVDHDRNREHKELAIYN